MAQAPSAPGHLRVGSPGRGPGRGVGEVARGARSAQCFLASRPRFSWLNFEAEPLGRGLALTRFVAVPWRLPDPQFPCPKAWTQLAYPFLTGVLKLIKTIAKDAEPLQLNSLGRSWSVRDLGVALGGWCPEAAPFFGFRRMWLRFNNNNLRVSFSVEHI